MVTCSPVAATTSSSRGSGSRASSRARPSSRLVSPAIADTTTTSWCPSAWNRATRRATLRMRSVVPTDVPPYFWTMSAIALHRAERERGVRPAEAERVRQCRADAHRPRGVRHEVEVALRVLPEQVRGGRCDLLLKRERGEDGL